MQTSEPQAQDQTFSRPSQEPDVKNHGHRIHHPALAYFLQSIGDQKSIAQLLIRKLSSSQFTYELRHTTDEKLDPEELHTLPVEKAQFYLSFNQEGAFRPIKGAPDMRKGWRITTHDPEELEQAVQAVYPGLITDYYAVHQMNPIPVTPYETFAGRQTGMYRSAKNLQGDRAIQAVQTACASKFCLKQRLWTVPGLEIDKKEEKSEIPCLEPCAVLLEWGRKVVRMDQIAEKCVESGGKPMQWTLTPDEAKSLQAAIEVAMSQPDPDGRTADVASPLNPRRLEWVNKTLEHLLNEGAMKE